MATPAPPPLWPLLLLVTLAPLACRASPIGSDGHASELAAPQEDDHADPKAPVMTINPKKMSALVGDRFLSITLDPQYLLEQRMNGPGSVRTLAMARGLAPAYVRLAGPSSDKMHFARGYGTSSNGSISDKDVEQLASWAQDTGMDLVLCLNALVRSDGGWDSRNSLDLLALTDRLGYALGWQLGYESAGLERAGVSGQQLGADLARASALLGEFPRYHGALLLGPDVAAPLSGRSSKEAAHYLQDVARAAAPKPDAVVWQPWPAAVSEGRDPVLDPDLERDDVNRLLGRAVARRPLWIAESGGEFTSRFVDALTWAQRIQVGARVGADVILRQPDLRGDSHQPSPDYWVSLLHKRLCGRAVLDSRLAGNRSLSVSAVSHCTAAPASGPAGRRATPRLVGGFTKLSYERGAVTVMAVNKGAAATKVALKLGGTQTQTVVHQYILTAPAGDLTSMSTLLNGQPLLLDNGGGLPSLSPKVLVGGRTPFVSVPANSVCFFVLPSAHARVCLSAPSSVEDAAHPQIRLTPATGHEVQISVDLEGFPATPTTPPPSPKISQRVADHPVPHDDAHDLRPHVVKSKIKEKLARTQKEKPKKWTSPKLNEQDVTSTEDHLAGKLMKLKMRDSSLKIGGVKTNQDAQSSLEDGVSAMKEIEGNHLTDEEIDLDHIRFKRGIPARNRRFSVDEFTERLKRKTKAADLSIPVSERIQPDKADRIAKFARRPGYAVNHRILQVPLTRKLTTSTSTTESSISPEGDMEVTLFVPEKEQTSAEADNVGREVEDTFPQGDVIVEKIQTGDSSEEDKSASFDYIKDDDDEGENPKEEQKEKPKSEEIIKEGAEKERFFYAPGEYYDALMKGGDNMEEVTPRFEEFGELELAKSPVDAETPKPQAEIQLELAIVTAATPTEEEERAARAKSESDVQKYYSDADELRKEAAKDVVDSTEDLDIKALVNLGKRYLQEHKMSLVRERLRNQRKRNRLLNRATESTPIKVEDPKTNSRDEKDASEERKSEDLGEKSRKRRSVLTELGGMVQNTDEIGKSDISPKPSDDMLQNPDLGQVMAVDKSASAKAEETKESSPATTVEKNPDSEKKIKVEPERSHSSAVMKIARYPSTSKKAAAMPHPEVKSTTETSTPQKISPAEQTPSSEKVSNQEDKSHQGNNSSNPDTAPSNAESPSSPETTEKAKLLTDATNAPDPSDAQDDDDSLKPKRSITTGEDYDSGERAMNNNLFESFSMPDDGFPDDLHMGIEADDTLLRSLSQTGGANDRYHYGHTPHEDSDSDHYQVVKDSEEVKDGHHWHSTEKRSGSASVTFGPHGLVVDNQPQFDDIVIEEDGSRKQPSGQNNLFEDDNLLKHYIMGSNAHNDAFITKPVDTQGMHMVMGPSVGPHAVWDSDHLTTIQHKTKSKSHNGHKEPTSHDVIIEAWEKGNVNDNHEGQVVDEAPLIIWGAGAPPAPQRKTKPAILPKQSFSSPSGRLGSDDALASLDSIVKLLGDDGPLATIQSSPESPDEEMFVSLADTLNGRQTPKSHQAHRGLKSGNQRDYFASHAQEAIRDTPTAATSIKPLRTAHRQSPQLIDGDSREEDYHFATIESVPQRQEAVHSHHFTHVGVPSISHRNVHQSHHTHQIHHQAVHGLEGDDNVHYATIELPAPNRHYQSNQELTHTGSAQHSFATQQLRNQNSRHSVEAKGRNQYHPEVMQKPALNKQDFSVDFLPIMSTSHPVQHDYDEYEYIDIPVASEKPISPSPLSHPHGSQPIHGQFLTAAASLKHKPEMRIRQEVTHSSASKRDSQVSGAGREHHILLTQPSVQHQHHVGILQDKLQSDSRHHYHESNDRGFQVIEAQQPEQYQTQITEEKPHSAQKNCRRPAGEKKPCQVLMAEPHAQQHQIEIIQKQPQHHRQESGGGHDYQLLIAEQPEQHQPQIQIIQEEPHLTQHHQRISGEEQEYQILVDEHPAHHHQKTGHEQEEQILVLSPSVDHQKHLKILQEQQSFHHSHQNSDGRGHHVLMAEPTASHHRESGGEQEYVLLSEPSAHQQSHIELIQEGKNLAPRDNRVVSSEEGYNIVVDERPTHHHQVSNDEQYVVLSEAPAQHQSQVEAVQELPHSSHQQHRRISGEEEGYHVLMPQPPTHHHQQSSDEQEYHVLIASPPSGQDPEIIRDESHSGIHHHYHESNEGQKYNLVMSENPPHHQHQIDIIKEEPHSVLRKQQQESSHEHEDQVLVLSPPAGQQNHFEILQEEEHSSPQHGHGESHDGHGYHVLMAEPTAPHHQESGDEQEYVLLSEPTAHQQSHIEVIEEKHLAPHHFQQISGVEDGHILMAEQPTQLKQDDEVLVSIAPADQHNQFDIIHEPYTSAQHRHRKQEDGHGYHVLLAEPTAQHQESIDEQEYVLLSEPPAHHQPHRVDKMQEPPHSAHQHHRRTTGEGEGYHILMTQPPSNHQQESSYEQEHHVLKASLPPAHHQKQIEIIQEEAHYAPQHRHQKSENGHKHEWAFELPSHHQSEIEIATHTQADPYLRQFASANGHENQVLTVKPSAYHSSHQDELLQGIEHPTAQHYHSDGGQEYALLMPESHEGSPSQVHQPQSRPRQSQLDQIHQFAPPQAPASRRAIVLVDSQPDFEHEHSELHRGDGEYDEELVAVPDSTHDQSSSKTKTAPRPSHHEIHFGIAPNSHAQPLQVSHQTHFSHQSETDQPHQRTLEGGATAYAYDIIPMPEDSLELATSSIHLPPQRTFSPRMAAPAKHRSNRKRRSVPTRDRDANHKVMLETNRLVQEVPAPAFNASDRVNLTGEEIKALQESFGGEDAANNTSGEAGSSVEVIPGTARKALDIIQEVDTSKAIDNIENILMSLVKMSHVLKDAENKTLDLNATAAGTLPWNLNFTELMQGEQPTEIDTADMDWLQGNGTKEDKSVKKQLDQNDDIDDDEWSAETERMRQRKLVRQRQKELEARNQANGQTVAGIVSSMLSKVASVIGYLTNLSKWQ